MTEVPEKELYKELIRSKNVEMKIIFPLILYYRPALETTGLEL